MASYPGDSSRPFHATPPRWSVDGTAINHGADKSFVEQGPFRWVDGAWEAEALVAPAGARANQPTRVALRVDPDTLRRWKDAGIDPVREAVAQLAEHLRGTARRGQPTTVTLL